MSLYDAAKKNTKLTDFEETKEIVVNYRTAVRKIPSFEVAVSNNQTLFTFMR